MKRLNSRIVARGSGHAVACTRYEQRRARYRHVGCFSCSCHHTSQSTPAKPEFAAALRSIPSSLNPFDFCWPSRFQATTRQRIAHCRDLHSSTCYFERAGVCRNADWTSKCTVNIAWSRPGWHFAITATHPPSRTISGIKSSTSQHTDDCQL